MSKKEREKGDTWFFLSLPKKGTLFNKEKK